MPFKPDFIDMMKKYSRLPFTDTEEALEMKLLEEAASTEGAKRILKENEELKNHLTRQKQYTTELMNEFEEEKSAFAKESCSAEVREKELKHEIQMLK
jgi:hypothetical protein